MIVVAGMHRSGTSLLAQILQAHGLDFGAPDRLYAADDWNANGYLERLDVVDLNSKAITGFERTTGRRARVVSQINYLRMPSTSAIGRSLDALSGEITELGAELSGLAVKDPRFCLTLSGWERHASVDGLVVALRHPSASVASLRRRNRLPPAIGHRFWRWHMEALLPRIGASTLVVRQDHLTGPQSDETIDRIKRWLVEVAGIEPSRTPADVIDTSLVHHQPDESGAPAESLDLWRSLLDRPAWT